MVSAPNLRLCSPLLGRSDTVGSRLTHKADGNLSLRYEWALAFTKHLAYWRSRLAAACPHRSLPQCWHSLASRLRSTMSLLHLDTGRLNLTKDLLGNDVTPSYAILRIHEAQTTKKSVPGTKRMAAAIECLNARESNSVEYRGQSMVCTTFESTPAVLPSKTRRRSRGYSTRCIADTATQLGDPCIFLMLR